MNYTLKREIINYIFDNRTQFQIVNQTTEQYRAYIYDSKGEYLIGGEQTSNFICNAVELVLREGEA